MNRLAYNQPEMFGSSMLAHQFGVASGSPEEDWADSQIPSVPVFDANAESVVVNLIPDAIRSNWFLLSRSKLPERSFNDLLMAAISHERTFSGPMKPLSSTSLRGFLRLWEAVRDCSAEPVLSLSPAGDVIAEWFRDPDNSLVVMSARDGNLFYSLFDQGQPCEGFADSENPGNMIAMFLACEPIPFGWSDADEG